MCVHAHVCVCLMRQGGPCWVAVLCGPLTLAHQFQSGSMTGTPLSAMTFFIRPPAPTRVLHYGALPGQCRQASPEEATGREEKEMKEVPASQKEKKNPDPISIKILPFSFFHAVITGLPKLYWEK